MPDHEFLTVEEVAVLLRCSQKSVRRWAANDSTLPVLRIGRTVRFPRERLLDWLREKSQGMGRKKAHRLAHTDVLSNGHA